MRRGLLPLTLLLAMVGAVGSCTVGSPTPVPPPRPSVTGQTPPADCVPARMFVLIMQAYGDGKPAGTIDPEVVCAESYSMGRMTTPSGDVSYVVVHPVGSGYEVETFDYHSYVACNERRLPVPLFQEICDPGPS